MFTYIAKSYSALLQKNQLDTFEKVWDSPVNWFEEPNERRGGWSGVGRIELEQEDGSLLGAFLKKQDKHCRTSLFHPIDGVPTFQREFEMMRYLAGLNVKAPEVLFFGRNPKGDLKTTLMTKELAGFVPLEQLTAEMFQNGRPSLAQQRAVVNAVAHFASQLHNAKVQHRSFYPKHIFVNAQQKLMQVAVIDLEKSRIQPIRLLRAIMDLSVLNRHAKFWSRTARLQFYKQYLGVETLNAYQKWLLKQIVKRSTRHKNNRTIKKSHQG